MNYVGEKTIRRRSQYLTEERGLHILNGGGGSSSIFLTEERGLHNLVRGGGGWGDFPLLDIGEGITCAVS